MGRRRLALNLITSYIFTLILIANFQIVMPPNIEVHDSPASVAGKCIDLTEKIDIHQKKPESGEIVEKNNDEINTPKLINTAKHGYETQLHWAAANNYDVICEYIIDQLVQKNPTDSQGLTPLHLALQNGHQNLCNMIMHKNMMWKKSSNEEKDCLKLIYLSGITSLKQKRLTDLKAAKKVYISRRNGLTTKSNHQIKSRSKNQKIKKIM